MDTVYLDLLRRVLTDGEEVVTRNDRVRRLVAEKVEFTSTPLVCVRRTAWKNCLREWEWFMSGSMDINDLHPSVRPWWEPWAVGCAGGRVVPSNYSSQFRRFYGEDGYPFDQIDALVRGVRDHPNSRRNVITTWNTADMNSPDVTITNCHGTVIQAFVSPSNQLTLVTYQRSVDIVCGLPHNWLQYWAFLLWLAWQTGREVGKLVWVGGDVHLYDAHRELAEKILRQSPTLATPQLVFRPSSQNFQAEDFGLDREYVPSLTDRAEMIV